MKECAPEVEIMLSASQEEHGRRAVDDDTEGSYDGDRVGGDWLRVGQALYRFPSDSAYGYKKKHGIEEGGEDRGAAESIAPPSGRWPLAESDRPPRKEECGDVAEVMAGIGEKGHRTRTDPEDHLTHHIEGVQSNADAKRLAKIGGRMAMPVMVRQRFSAL